MKRFLLACFAFLLAALHTGGAVAQGPSARALLLEGGSSCPASVRLTSLPAQYQCPAVSLQLASGTAWVKGTGFVPLSTLLNITNASGGYVTDWSGAMTWKFGPVTNLVTSFDYSSATYWGVTGLQTPTGGQIDPNGGTSAALLTETAGSSTHLLFGVGSNSQNFVSGTTYFQSFSSKQGTAQYIQLTLPVAAFSGVGYANVNLTNCTISASGGTFVAVGAVAQSNGYCRGWIAATATATTSAPAVGPIFINNNPSAARLPTYVGTGQTITATFPQVEALSYATQTAPASYILTNGSTATSTAQLRQANGTGLLVEESRTNVLQRSNFDNGFTTWFQAGTPTGGSLVANSGAAPDGTNTAALFTAGTATFNNILRQQTFAYTAGTTYTLTVYVKPSASTAQYLGFRMANWAEGVASDLYPFINLSTMATSANGHSGVTFSVVAVANGWWRVGISVATNAASSSITDIAIVTSSGNSNTAALAGQTLLLWGAQAEARAFPTSYCPTTSTAATCNQDQITAAGALLAAMQASTGTVLGSTYGLNLNGGARLYTTTNNTSLLFNSTTSGQFSDGAASLLANFGAGNTGATARIVGAHDATSASITVNGGTVSTGAFAYNAGSAVFIGNIQSAWNRALNGYLTRLDVWPQRLPDSVLPSLTAPAPVLLTDFANGRYTWNGYDLGAGALTSLFSVANSGGYCTTSAGLLVSFPSNTLRICSGTGVLPEDTRTNGIRNNSMQGTIPGTPGTLPTNWASGVAGVGLNQQVVGTGTESGIDYIDLRIFGTTSSPSTANAIVQFDGAVQAATNGQTFTSSAYVTLIAGSIASLNNISITTTSRNAGGSFLSSGVSIFIPGASGQLGRSRFTNTYTIPDATAAFASTEIRQNVNSGVAVDFTLRIGWPQLEPNASFPSSPIRTTTVAVTRNFDNIQALGPVLNLLGTQGANSMAAAWQGSPYYPSGAAPTRQYVATWSDVGNTRWSWRAADVALGLPNFTVGDGTAVTTLSNGSSNYAAGTAMKSATRWNNTAADMALFVNGSTISSPPRQFGATLGAPFYIGGSGGGTGQISAPLGCLAFFPGGLTNTQLQAPGVCQ